MAGTSTHPRVQIRLVQQSDAPAMAELLARNRDHFRTGEPLRPDEYYTTEGQRRAIEEGLKARAAGTETQFLIEADDALVGRIGLQGIARGAFQSASVAYGIDRARTNQGLATAALRQVIRVAFDELNLHRVSAQTLPDNAPSQRVLTRCGFVWYGRAPDLLKIDGRWQTQDLFQLINHNHRAE